MIFFNSNPKHTHKKEYFDIYYTDIRDRFVATWTCECGELGKDDIFNFKELNLTKEKAKWYIQNPHTINESEEKL